MNQAERYYVSDFGNGNAIDLSSVRNLYKVYTLKSFGLKYVLDGTETYTVNNRRYKISPGRYLLVNPTCSCSLEILAPEPVKGLCIDLNPELLADVTKTLAFPKKADKQEVLDFMLGDRFFENSYNHHQTHTGIFLQKVQKVLVANPERIEHLTEEFYMQLAEILIMDQLLSMEYLKAIPSVKYNTQKELLRCLLMGKEYMDDCFLEKPSIALMADAANMSEYHFFRLFRSVFGVTPYQYALEKRLLHARELVRDGKLSLQEIALKIGFSDHSVLSKAFRKRFGIPPSQISRI